MIKTSTCEVSCPEVYLSCINLFLFGSDFVLKRLEKTAKTTRTILHVLAKHHRSREGGAALMMPSPPLWWSVVGGGCYFSYSHSFFIWNIRSSTRALAALLVTTRSSTYHDGGQEAEASSAETIMTSCHCETSIAIRFDLVPNPIHFFSASCQVRSQNTFWATRSAQTVGVLSVWRKPFSRSIPSIVHAQDALRLLTFLLTDASGVFAIARGNDVARGVDTHGVWLPLSLGWGWVGDGDFNRCYCTLIRVAMGMWMS